MSAGEERNVNQNCSDRDECPDSFNAGEIDRVVARSNERTRSSPRPSFCHFSPPGERATAGEPEPGQVRQELQRNAVLSRRPGGRSITTMIRRRKAVRGRRCSRRRRRGNRQKLSVVDNSTRSDQWKRCCCCFFSFFSSFSRPRPRKIDEQRRVGTARMRWCGSQNMGQRQGHGFRNPTGDNCLLMMVKWRGSEKEEESTTGVAHSFVRLFGGRPAAAGSI